MLAHRPFKKTNRSAYVNFLRAKYEAYTGQVQVMSRPYYLCVDPCDICQLRCPTCPTGMENADRRAHTPEAVVYRQHRSTMTSNLFDALVDELGEYLFLIKFYNWGEPLLNKQLPAFVRIANRASIETEVHTNLSLPLSDARIDELLTSGLDYLVCSIDGFSQETYRTHRVGGDFDLVKRNLERLAQAKVRLGVETIIAYKFLVFSFNEHEVPAAERYCRDLGISFMQGDAFIYDPSWLPSHRKAEQPHHSEAEMNAIVADWEAAGLGAYWSDRDKRPAWLAIAPSDESKPASFCGWHYGYSVVTAGGPVAPCCGVSKERDDFGTVVPNVVSFGDLWNNDSYRSSRAAFAGRNSEGPGQDTVCTRCYFPAFVQHLYDGHDRKVFAQFNTAIGATDAALQQAFRLWFMVETGGEALKSRFIEYFRANFLEEPLRARSEKPRVWMLSETP